MSVKTLTGWFVATACALSICSCGSGTGRIKVKGRVYAQASSAGNSQILIDKSQSANSDLSPVQGARVTLYHGTEYSKEKADRNEMREDSTVSDADGNFEIDRVTSPSPVNVSLVVDKMFYKAAVQVFLHDKPDHDAVIILVPDKPLLSPLQPLTRPYPWPTDRSLE